MKYQKPHLDKQFEEELEPLCAAIALYADMRCQVLFGCELTVTSVFREKTTDSGIHALLRAVDMDNDKDLTPEQKQELCDMINDIFVYDVGRKNFKVCKYHSVGGTWGGDHLHIQIHPATRQRIYPK